MLATSINAPDLLAPLQPAADDAAARYRLAFERERRAWKLLNEGRAARDADQRSAAFREWVDANNEMREAQSQTTSAAIRKAVEEMRGCAAVLAKDAMQEAGASDFESSGFARLRSYFQGRGGAVWKVVNMTMDVLEPELFLLQMECSNGNAASNGVHDVYCEDWALFCVVHGLSAAPGPSAGH